MDSGISASLYNRCNATGYRLVSRLERGQVCVACRLARQRECLTGPLNICQAFHCHHTGLHLLHISCTKHLAGDPANQTGYATLLPLCIPCLWKQCNGPALIRPQRWGGYIGPADTNSHKAKQTSAAYRVGFGDYVLITSLHASLTVSVCPCVPYYFLP